MIWRGGVKIIARERASFSRFGVVILESDDPLSRRRLLGALTDGALNLSYLAQIAIYFAQVASACASRVRVRCTETGSSVLAYVVDLARPLRGQRPTLAVVANGRRAPAGHRDRLRAGLARVRGQDVGVVQDQLRFRAFEPQQ